jgi:carboxypeptidase C (cathepsin A)
LDKTSLYLKKMCCGDDEKPKPNAFDVLGEFHGESSFLGAPHHFGYVSMSHPKPKKGIANQGFYWLWECENPNMTDAPVLVSCVGGPGMCIIPKILGYLNPIEILPGTHKLVRNRDSITDRCNLLYLECPTGSGFSVCAKGNEVRSFAEIGLNAQEVVEEVLHMMPHLRNVNWYFTGESFCGLSVPKIADQLTQGPLKLPYGGMSLYCPVFNFEEIMEYDRRLELLKKHDLLGGCCKECCYTCISACCLCCFECGCIDFNTFETVWFLPLMTDNEYTEGKGANKKTFNKTNLVNLREKNRDVENDVRCSNEVIAFVTSDHFHNYIGAKKHVGDIADESQVVIMEKDKTYTSDPLINKLVATGRPYSLVTGEGDLIVPWKVVKDQAEKYWDIYKRMKQDPNCDNWITEPQGRFKYKKFENFEWRRAEKCGHIPFVDDPQMFTEHLTNFIDDGEGRKARMQVSQSPVRVSHAPVEVIGHSYVSPAKPAQSRILTHESYREPHGHQQQFVRSNVLGGGTHSMAVQGNTHSYKPYRMANSTTDGFAHGGSTVVRKEVSGYNPYTSGQQATSKVRHEGSNPLNAPNQVSSGVRQGS